MDHRLNLWHGGKWSERRREGEAGDEACGYVGARRRERNHTINVIIYQKASLSPHKPKCHRLNPALIRPALSGEDRQQRGD